MKPKRATVMFALSALLMLAGPAWASPRALPAALPAGDVVAPEGVQAMILARDGVSLDQAAAMVRRQTGGRIIKASSRRSNGRTVHYIRVLTRDGRVFTVRVDAASGRVL